MAIEIADRTASIIIPVYNGLSYTKKCLGSIIDHTDTCTEIIVVDNASSDGTALLLKSARNRVHTIRNSRNLGYAKACNQGYRNALGRYLIFLNNDTIVTANWLKPLLDCFTGEKPTGLVTPKLLYPQSRTVQYAGVAFHVNGLPYILNYRKPDLDKTFSPRDVPAAGGACMVVKREVFERVGFFDEKYFNGLEDIDLSLRIKKAGYQTLYCPQSKVFHFESRTAGRLRYNEANRQHYLKKWKDQFSVTSAGEIIFN